MFDICLNLKFDKENKTVCTSNNFKSDDTLNIKFDDELNVFFGENGAGKSFVWLVFTYLGYLYSVACDRSKPTYSNSVIKRLADSNVGEVLDLKTYRTPSFNDGKICLRSIYDPKRTKAAKVGDVYPDTLKYLAKLGSEIEKIYDDYQIIYYSNSQFPSNLKIISQDVVSVSSSNIDPVFWCLKNSEKFCDGSFCRDAKISLKLWKNNFFNSMGDKIEDIFDLDDEKFSGLKESVFKEYYDALFFVEAEWNDSSFKERIKKCTFRNIIENLQCDKKFPEEIVEIDNSLDCYDYFLYLLVKKKWNDLHCSIIYDDVEYDLLNSGKKYYLMLHCLSLIPTNKKKQIFIVDEPENAMHISKQEKMTDNMPSTAKKVLVTHSPALLLNLLKSGEDFSFYQVENANPVSIINGNVPKINPKSNPLLSLDAIAADFFGYSPVIDKWNEINPPEKYDSNNFISIDDFYRDIKSLK